MASGPDSGVSSASATAMANVADNTADNPANNTAPANHADRFMVVSTGRLGQGAEGTVYKAWDKELCMFVAVKEVDLRGKNDSCLSILKGEFDTLRRLEHPNIVGALAFHIDPSEEVGKIAMELMPFGSLHAVLRETKRPMKERIVARYVRDLLNGLSYLHSQNILHGDTKTGNMLLGSGGNVKWTDCGTSKAVADMRNFPGPATLFGTVAYLAPERFHGHFSKGSDIWGLGCSLLEMLTAEVPWSDSGCGHQMALEFHICNSKPPNHHPPIPPVRSSEAAPTPTIDDDDSPLVMADDRVTFRTAEGVGPVYISAAAHSFLKRCFEFDPKDRPSADELLLDPFVAGDELK